MQRLALQGIRPTPFLKEVGGRLRQLVRLALQNPGAATAAFVTVGANDTAREWPLDEVPAGESVHEVYVDEIDVPTDVTFILGIDGMEVGRTEVAWLPPRRWVVHVVQLSHHDVGYTDLASHVLPLHDRYLDGVIDMAEATKHFPDEAQCRIVVEQAWSIWHYMRRASPAPVRARVSLPHLDIGDVVLTNLVEVDGQERIPHESHRFEVNLESCAVMTIRVLSRQGASSQ